MDKNDGQENFDRLAALHIDRFKKGFYEALEDINTHYIKTSHLYRPGEKATLMHAHVRDRMNKNFAGVPGVKIEDKSGRAYKIRLDGAPHGIEAKAEFKCKKNKPNLLTSSIMTKAVELFQKGLPERKRTPHIQPPLGDIREPEITGGIEPGHGNAGYVINDLWTAFEGLYITEHTGIHSVRLSAAIPLDNNGSMAEVVELPLADIKEVITRKRVKHRKVEAASVEEKPKKKRIKQETIESNLPKDKENRKKAVNDESDN
jgi:hypothetical protein